MLKSKHRWTLLLGLMIGGALAAGYGTPMLAESHEHEHESALHETMEEVGPTVRKLRGALAKKDAAESLMLIHQLQSLTAEALKHQPDLADTQPDADRAKFVLAYKRQMAQLYQAELDLEEALLNGDHDQAQALYKSLHEHKEKGHAQFQEKED